jgi:hypothetical protein
VEKSVLNVECPENLGFKKWSLILKISRSKKTTDTVQLSYTASNISAQNKRIIVRHLVPFYPKMMGLELFTWRTLMVLLKAGKNLGSGILVNIDRHNDFTRRNKS